MIKPLMNTPETSYFSAGIEPANTTNSPVTKPPVNYSLVAFGAYFAVAFLAFSFLDKANFVRWLLYAIPAVLMALAALRPADLKLDVGLLTLPLGYLLVFLISSITAASPAPSADVYRALVTYLLFFSACAFRFRTSPRVLLATCCVMFVLSLVVSLNKTSSTVLFDIYDSDSATESVFGIFYAIAAILFVTERRFASALVCVAFSVVSFKRNAWLGLVATSGVALFWEPWRRSIRASVTRRQLDLMVICGSFTLMFIASFCISDVFRWILVTYLPNDTMQHITVGRDAIWQIADGLIQHMSLKEVLTGYGPGYLENILESAIPGSGGLAHNEYKALFLNYGLFGIAFYLAFLVGIYRSTASGFYFCMYIIVTSQVENFFYVFIYSVPSILFVRAMLPHEETLKSGQDDRGWRLAPRSSVVG